MNRPQLPDPLALRARNAVTRCVLGRRGIAPAESGLAIPLRSGLTIVEMLVAMSITLLIMAAVVTVFANISASVTRRRATIEMSSALRGVRETLARDLAGATCPAVTWQRPEANHGYIELIEGPQNDYYPTPWLWDGDDANNESGDPISDDYAVGSVTLPGIDLSISSLPGSNLRSATADLDEEGAGLYLGQNAPVVDYAADGTTPTFEGPPTDGRGLGDADDILMLTVRNESEPFVGRIPSRAQLTGTFAVQNPASPGSNQVAFANWRSEETDSPLAEVVWHAVENPSERSAARTFAFGEAGYRTIYRRALLVLPELDYRIRVGAQTARPGTVWVLPEQSTAGGVIEREDVAAALACLIAFQERYDLSVRLEWDPLLPNASDSDDGLGRWVLRANSLSDLTKRENRYEHSGYAFAPPTLVRSADNPEPGPTGVSDRYFPFAAVSAGLYGSATANVEFRANPALVQPADPANFTAVTAGTGSNRVVVGYVPEPAEGADEILSGARVYPTRPFVRVTSSTDRPATARAILNEDGNVVHVTRGLAPLGGDRRGEDIMMTDALAFDLRVYDPGAPVYGYYRNGNPNQPAEQLLEPGDPAWVSAYQGDATEAPGWIGDGLPNVDANYPFLLSGQGEYVDLGYSRTSLRWQNNGAGQILEVNRFVPYQLAPLFGAPGSTIRESLFGQNDEITRLRRREWTPLFSYYDTWSWHYENNGVNEDLDQRANGAALVDEGTNAADDLAIYYNPTDRSVSSATAFGPDDYAERETRPPYDTALRGLQVTLRVYERDSRQIREVQVRESFVPE